MQEKKEEYDYENTDMSALEYLFFMKRAERESNTPETTVKLLEPVFEKKVKKEAETENKTFEEKKQEIIQKALDKTYIDQENARLEKKRKEKMVYKLNNVFNINKLDLAEQFYEVQPFFFDKNCIWWVWNFNKNVYEMVDETEMIASIDESMGRNNQILKSRKEILEALKTIGRKKIPKELPKNFIQFKDCIYDIETDERKEANFEYFCINPIPWKLGESEETPKLDELFSQWVNTQEEVKLLYEIMAYCLYPDYPISRIFCLYGKGSNGKSVYMKILSKFLGEDNCCSTSLETLIDNRFESSKLYKKLMCRLSEIHERMLSKTSLLKNISGGDYVSVEFKNKTPFDSLIYSKIIIGTNTIPITMDATDGFYRRWVVIDFPNQFSEKRDIMSEIPDKEFENFALKSIRLIKKILMRREFSFEYDLETRKKRYNERANPIESFIDDICEHDINSDVLFSDLYNVFEKYLSEKGFRRLNKREFGKALRNIGIETKKKSENGFFSTFVVGLKLKKQPKQPKQPKSHLVLHTRGAELEHGCFGWFGCSNDENRFFALMKIVQEISINDLIKQDFDENFIEKQIKKGNLITIKPGFVKLNT